MPAPGGLSSRWVSRVAAALVSATRWTGLVSSAPPVTLPETPGWCEQLQSAVRQIADDSGRAEDLSPAARAYDKAVTCLFANRISRPYTYDSVPNAAQRAAFQHFLSQAAISEARR